MSTIFGDGGIRRAPEPRPRLPAEALTRAGDLARSLAAMLDERNPQGPQETARLLVEVGRLPAEAQEAFLAAAASEGGPRERAKAVSERIARAYPETSDRRRELGAALVSVEGGEPAALVASVLEAKVTGALAKLGTVCSARTLSADTMERARGFGLFGGSPGPTPPSPTGLEVSAATIWRVEGLGGSVQQVARLATTAAALRTEQDAAVSAAWQPVLARAQEIAPGLTNGIVSMGLAQSAIAAVRQGLGQVGEGKGFWARARNAAGEDAMGRIAARLESMRDRIGGGLEVAAPLSAVSRAENLATVAQELRGEAVGVQQDIQWARELVPDVELGPVGSTQAALEHAEAEMGAAEYGLQAYATQQDMVSEAPALTPDMITPEVIAELRASGQVPPEILAQLESGDITPEILAQLQGGGGAGGITREELERIGTGITGTPPQGFWNVGTVGAGMDPAIFNGDEYSRTAAEAVNRTLPDPTSVRTIDGAVLAAAIRDMGVPLEKVDPNQLQAAVDFINTGASGAVAEFGQGAPKTADEQRERMALALRQCRYLAEQGPPPMDRRTAINVCWSAARIPGHAFEGMSDTQVLAVAQQTAAACNTPGNHEFKVGRHTVKLTIGENNTVKSTSTKPPSAWGKIGSIANVVLSVASFFPPPVGVAARCVQAGIALVKAIRNGGGFLDIVSAGASFVGAGASAIRGIAKAGSSVASIAGNVARVANSVSGVARGVQGIQRGGVGGVISGVAGVASGIAGGIQGAGGSAAPGSVSAGFAGVGRVLGQVGAGVGAAENYIHANRAVSEARVAVEQARASGDAAQIQRAERQLAEAERGKRSTVLGGLATAGQIAGDTLSRNSGGQPDPRTGQVRPQGRSGFQVGAEIFSRGMNTARGVNDGDLLTAGVEALGAAAAARQGRQPILGDENGNPTPGQLPASDDFDFLNQASSVLDGLNDWRGAERSERQAREVLGQAEQALGRARASGNPEAIREAEASLRQARRGLVQADLGSTLALDNAAQRFTGAVALRNELGRTEVLRTRLGDKAAQLAAVLDDPRSSPPDRAAALEQFARLSLAARDYEQAAASGDGERMRVARLALEETQAALGLLPGLPRVAAVVGRPGAERDAESTSTSAGRQAVEDIDRRLPWLAEYGKPPAEAAPPTGTWYEELLLWRGEQQGRFVQWLSSLGRSAGEGAVGERPPTVNTITRQQLAAALEDDPALAEALWQEVERNAPAGRLRETAGDVGQVGGAVGGQLAWDSAEGKALLTLFSGVLAGVASGRLGALPSSRALGANLEAAGFVRPADAAAHHMVAGLHKPAAEARAILSRFGIDINDAANGVFLPRNKNVLTPPPGALHSSLHSNAYYYEVERLLGRATTRQKAIETLGLIRQRLLEGRFP